MSVRKIAVRGTKSDDFRARFAAGETVAAVARETGNGYAFVFGVASRTPDPAVPGKSYADTRADRRPVRSVRTAADGTVVVAVAGPGKIRFVSVRPDGTVRRTAADPTAG